jgi:hypothetical protein
MRCAKAAQQLQIYIDHRLTVDQMRALEGHLFECTHCQEELFRLEEITSALRGISPVVEPADLTTNIMQRVAASTRSPKKVQVYKPLRPSFAELLLVIVLATATTLVVIVQQPTLRGSLPFADNLGSLPITLNTILHALMGVSTNTLQLALWVIGTLLGVCITLAAAGNEMRSVWFKAMIDHLPVW